MQNSSFAQSGQKFASGGNTLSNGEFLGTTNNFPLDVKINNMLRGTFTSTGFNVYGNLHATRNTMVDSILSSWRVMVADALSVGGPLTVSGNAIFNGNASISGVFKGGQISISGNGITSDSGNISFGNDSLSTAGNISSGNITTLTNDVSDLQTAVGELNTSQATQQNEIDSLQSAVGSLQSSVGSLQSEVGSLQSEVGSQQSSISDLQSSITTHDSLLSNLTSSQWQNDTVASSNIYYDGGNVGIGTSSPSEPLEVSGRIKISGSPSGTDSSGGPVPPGMGQSQSIIIDGGIDRITATSGTLSFANTNLTTTGNIQAGSIGTGQLIVSDKFSAKTIVTDTISPNPGSGKIRVLAQMSAEAIRVDTLSVSKKFSAEKSISSDTLVAVRQLDVNHNLSLGSDSSSSESDIASKVQILTIQSGPAATYDVAISAESSSKVGIGTKTPTEKLSVDGNIRVSGNVTAAGTVNAGTLNASRFFSDTLFSSRILPAPGDSEIALGEATIIVNSFSNSINTSFKGTICNRDLSIQSQIPPSPYPLGYCFINNTLINPYMGKVGIGTDQPYKILTVNGDVSFANYNSSGGGNPGDGFSGFEIKGGDDGSGTKKPTRRGITTDFDPNGPLNFYINTNQPNSGFNFKNGNGTPVTLMTIRGDGKVGIGTVSPSAELEITSPGMFINNTLPIVKNTGTYGAGWRFIPGGNSKEWAIHATGPGNTSQGPDKVVFKCINDSTTAMTISSTDPFSQGGEGRVGIGTTDPKAKLHVKDGNLLVENPSGSWIHGWKRAIETPMSYVWKTSEPVWASTSGPAGYYLGYGITHTGFYWIISDNGAGNVLKYPMRLDLNANGKPTLTVQEDTWHDEVFDENYKRPTFEEQEQFFKKHKHLPGIASEKEILESGVDITGTLKGLTMNVEETRLDMIELYKMIQEQKKIIEKQRKEIEKLNGK